MLVGAQKKSMLVMSESIPDCRLTGSNPFHSSRGALAAILPLFPRRLQLPIPVGLNLLLMPGEHVLRRDVADGAVRRTLL
jgi:hypothetical protein